MSIGASQFKSKTWLVLWVILAEPWGSVGRLPATNILGHVLLQQHVLALWHSVCIQSYALLEPQLFVMLRLVCLAVAFKMPGVTVGSQVRQITNACAAGL
jgi:hypothetical protein